MDKRKINKKRSLKVFEEASTSRETTPDPFSDDGEYGSDEDYDPKNSSFSDGDYSTVSNENAHTRHSRSTRNNSNSEYSDTGGSSDSSDSIFDSRVPKKMRRTLDQDNSGDNSANADTISLNSSAFPVSPSEEIESNPGSPAPLPEERESNPGSPAPLPEEMENNPGSPAPLLEGMESNPGSPAPLPEEIENNPGSPAPLPEEVESNPGIPTPLREEIESNPRFPEPVQSNSPLRPRNRSVSPVRLRLLLEETEISAGPPTSPIANVENNPSHHSSRGRTRNVSTERRRWPRNRTPSPAVNWEDSTVEIPIFDFDTNSTGVQFEIDATTSAIDVFNKLFPPHIIDYIITSTNNYGRALCNTNRPMTRNSRRFRYKDTNSEEIKKFLGLCLQMGQVNVPKKCKLFTYSDNLYYHPIFPFTMSARRFEQILRCLYVSHIGAKGKEKINKFIDGVTKNFRDCYKATRELSLDESMLLFRGRLSFRQYIKSKKARYGIKFYELTTSDGYVLNLQMYTGKEDNDIEERGKKTEKIVMRLMRPYLLNGHWLFMDNYYNSVSLSEKLLSLKTHTTGTLRKNRKDNPKDLISKKLKKNEHVWARRNKVYVSKWHDKRSVIMVTTLNHPKLVEISNRRGHMRLKPEEVTTYNKFMSGIDRADQMVSYYSTPRKTLRWHKKVFFHLLDLAVWNSFFIYKKYCKNNSAQYEFLTFREDLIKSLIQLPQNLKPSDLIKLNRFDNRIKERRDFLPIENAENLPSTGHWPEKIPVRSGSKKTRNYMKCKMCAKKKLRRETSLRCKGCEEKPALCGVCFEEWHSQ